MCFEDHSACKGRRVVEFLLGFRTLRRCAQAVYWNLRLRCSTKYKKWDRRDLILNSRYNSHYLTGPAAFLFSDFGYWALLSKNRYYFEINDKGNEWQRHSSYRGGVASQRPCTNTMWSVFLQQARSPESYLHAFTILSDAAGVAGSEVKSEEKSPKWVAKRQAAKQRRNCTRSGICAGKSTRAKRMWKKIPHPWSYWANGPVADSLLFKNWRTARQGESEDLNVRAGAKSLNCSDR